MWKSSLLISTSFPFIIKAIKTFRSDTNYNPLKQYPCLKQVIKYSKPRGSHDRGFGRNRSNH